MVCINVVDCYIKKIWNCFRTLLRLLQSSQKSLIGPAFTAQSNVASFTRPLHIFVNVYCLDTVIILIKNADKRFSNKIERSEELNISIVIWTHMTYKQLPGQ